MSIASEITSIGENLKKDYQAIANLGADLTNVDKNIENIAELLDGVYDNLPKTSYQEGTEINLGVTSKGKLDFENGVVGIGQTEQDGEPTPSTPIAINSVTGNQDVVVKDGNNNTIATYQLSLGDIELNAIGNYKDELIYDVENDKVYKNEKIGKVVLNGSENWVSFTYGTNSWRLSSVVNTNFNANEVLIMSRKFKGIPQANRDDNFAQIYIETSGTQLTIRNTTYTTKAEVQSGMNGEPLFYVLATPTLTEITDTNLHNQVKMLYNAQSLNGTTIVTSSGNLPMIIKIRALKGSS